MNGAKKASKMRAQVHTIYYPCDAHKYIFSGKAGGRGWMDGRVGQGGKFLTFF